MAGSARAGRGRREARSRSALVLELRARLAAESSPRLHVLLIVGLAGAAGFLVSAASLHAGLESMAVRYPLAALLAYLVFVGLLRLWIAWQRGRLDPLDALDLDVPGDGGAGGTGDPPGGVEQGGEMGGGGAGRSWDADATPDEPLTQAAAEAPGWSLGDAGASHTAEAAGGALDADEIVLVLIAVALLLGGFTAAAYVVYTAPLLLAEVALDAALISAAYRRLRRRDAQHWARGVLRRTWLPALLLVASSALLGLALASASPGARSIGEAFAALRGY